MNGKPESTRIIEDEPHACTDFYKDKDMWRCKKCDKFASPLSDCCGAPLVVKEYTKVPVCWTCGYRM